MKEILSPAQNHHPIMQSLRKITLFLPKTESYASKEATIHLFSSLQVTSPFVYVLERCFVDSTLPAVTSESKAISHFCCLLRVFSDRCA